MSSHRILPTLGDNRHDGTSPYFSGASLKALRQTSLWMMLATLAPPESGSFQVKASGIDAFLAAI